MDLVRTIAATGALLLLASVTLLALTRKTRRRRKALSKPFPPDWTQVLETRLLWYRELDEDDRERFRKRVLVFLSDVKITGIETDADDVTRLLVAASAIIPVFGYPDWEYRTLSEVLIYPTRFDNEYRFVKRRNANLGMTVHPTSTVILAKDALANGYRSRRDELNTGIHEFLHKVDAEDGELDGVPSLLLEPAIRDRWFAVVEKETERLFRGRSDIDPYAAEDETEFFPVVGEYFFEAPRKMSRLHPELYGLLCRMFRQDPLGSRSRAEDARD